MKRVIVIFLVVTLGFCLTSFPVKAENGNSSSVYLGETTTKTGYTLKSADENLIMGVWPDALKSSARLTIENLGKEDLQVPEDKTLISDLYVFNFENKGFADFNKPYTIVLKYDSENSSKKAIYFYNKCLNKWSEVAPAVVNEENKFIRVNLSFPYAQLAVLEEKVEQGMASWYRYKGGFFAAHPVYEKGTQVKVTNLENDKSVTVTINDWGPDRTVHPERIIDLDAVAFREIGKLSEGVARVKVEKL